MFEQLNNRFARIIKNIKGQGKITEENISSTLRDVRIALLEADVNFHAAKSFINRVKESATGKDVFTSVTPGQQFIKIILDELTLFLGSDNDGISFDKSDKTIILLAGLQGAGKTTTAVKLACFLKKRWQKNPFLIAADLQRPAAIDQLEVLSSQVNMPIYANRGAKVESVIDEGLVKGVNHDVIIIDTAGRLHIDDSLMIELETIIKLSNPNEIFYVADGMTGQDAVNSSNAFNEKLDLTGVILTKMDADARGGAALSIKEVTGKPIKFVGMGEKIQDFDLFHPDRMAKRILGMGDVISIVEKAQDIFDNDETKKIHSKILNENFTLMDFQDQLNQMKKMGPISNIVKMLPGAANLKGLNVNDKQLVWTDAIIKSMTPYERSNPDVINGSRRKRIANGSGRSIQEVNQLLKQFHQIKKMMKKMKTKRNIKFPFGIK